MFRSPHTSQSKRICLDFPSLHPSGNIPSLFDPGTGKGMSQTPNLFLVPSFCHLWLRFETDDVVKEEGGVGGSSSETKIAKWKFSPAQELK